MTDYKKIVDKCCLTVTNEMNAWEIVTLFFPNCSFDKAECKSKRAGYSVYEVHQHDEDMWNGDYVCSLGDRLEINFGNGFSKNIWIKN